MEILRIDVSKKKKGFEEIYDILENDGSFIVCRGNFVFMTENEDAKNILKNIEDTTVFEVEDIEKDIQEDYVKSWLKEEIIKSEIEKGKQEINERIEAVYNILIEAEKIVKEKEELEKQDEQQKTKLQKDDKTKQ